MSTELQSEFRYLQRSVTSASRSVDAITNRVASEVRSISMFFLLCQADKICQSNGLIDAAEMYHTATTTRLSGLQQVTRTLADQGTQEDMPTGTTPRKRVMECVDQWPLTKGRDAILREWRRGGRSRAPSDADSDDHLPPLTVENKVDKETASGTARLDDAENTNPTPPPTLSFGPHLSPQAPDPEPRPEKKSASIVMGTLTDRPMNAPEPRRSRRAR